ncbi:lysozyme inhibitor LprI family protein [Maritalea sp. S77]|uniref:lysozyme inhibitor LprI family protein n=1 Tax=Maritalea sp. S77 TaxID=3415125 RepID=UPI003C7BDA8E
MNVKMIAIAGFFAALTTPVLAQDNQFTTADEIQMQNCWEAVTDLNMQGEEHSLSECIGAASNVCMEEEEGGMTTVGMASCIMRENSWWDSILNINYQNLKQILEPKQFEDLRDAQRKWIAYRDASCAFHYNYWGNGTMRSTAFAGCMLDTTARRASELSNILDMSML